MRRRCPICLRTGPRCPEPIDRYAAGVHGLFRRVCSEAPGLSHYSMQCRRECIHFLAGVVERQRRADRRRDAETMQDRGYNERCYAPIRLYRATVNAQAAGIAPSHRASAKGVLRVESVLDPREPMELPATARAAVLKLVQLAFKTLQDIESIAKTSLCQRLGRGYGTAAAEARPTAAMQHRHRPSSELTARVARESHLACALHCGRSHRGCRS
jgi:hypothetical protein